MVKAITRKGYKNPTPIQRKTIPPIMNGRDVVGMARTGSGKTASFVLPMIEKLKMHSARVRPESERWSECRLVQGRLSWLQAENWRFRL